MYIVDVITSKSDFFSLYVSKYNAICYENEYVMQITCHMRSKTI